MPKIGVQSRSLPRTIPLKPELLKRKVYLGKLPIYRLSMRRVRRDSKERVRLVRRRFDVLRDYGDSRIMKRLGQVPWQAKR
jgi:hypothetical protein